MESVRQYLLSVTAAAIICSITGILTDKKGAYAAIVKLVSGLFLALTVISPWTEIELTDFSFYAQGLSVDANEAVMHGTQKAQIEMAQIIKQQTEAYILDKATALGMNVTISVVLNDETLPAPKAVTITGTASPYAKSVLSQYIESNLAIPEENQTWT